ncbi:UNVERIFIED_CONTAM: Mitochondrial fission process protein 1, partial [Eudyptes robustus]
KGDLYRDTPIRFLGYANEIGEAFRAWIPVAAVKATYVVASSYVIADAFDKTHKVYKKPFQSKVERHKQLGITLLDTLAWQTFASVIIPGMTINRLVATSTFGLKKFSRLAPTSIKLVSTGLGLVTIPFIVRPIDAFVEVGMEHSLRKLY